MEKRCYACGKDKPVLIVRATTYNPSRYYCDKGICLEMYLYAKQFAHLPNVSIPYNTKTPMEAYLSVSPPQNSEYYRVLESMHKLYSK